MLCIDEPTHLETTRKTMLTSVAGHDQDDPRALCGDDQRSSDVAKTQHTTASRSPTYKHDRCTINNTTLHTYVPRVQTLTKTRSSWPPPTTTLPRAGITGPPMDATGAEATALSATRHGEVTRTLGRFRRCTDMSAWPPGQHCCRSSHRFLQPLLPPISSLGDAIRFDHLSGAGLQMSSKDSRCGAGRGAARIKWLPRAQVACLRSSFTFSLPKRGG